jgi:hypothetical protein
MGYIVRTDRVLASPFRKINKSNYRRPYVSARARGPVNMPKYSSAKSP